MARGAAQAQRKRPRPQPKPKRKPKNLDLLNAIAGIYRNETSTAKNDAAAAQDALSSRSVTPPGLDINSTLGQALGADPLTQELRTKATEAFSKLTTAYSKAENAYRAVALATRCTSQEPNAQLALAGVAVEARHLGRVRRDHVDAANPR